MIGEPKNYTFNVAKYNFKEPKFLFPEQNNPIVLMKVFRIDLCENSVVKVIFLGTKFFGKTYFG